jgi:hypothetical protein
MNEQLIAVNQFILVATEAAARLHEVSSQRNRDVAIRALQKGREDYAALLTRRDDLRVRSGDTSVVDVLLDGVEARMKFLRSRL